MTEATELPPSLRANPQLDDWIRINPEGTVTVRTGKVELGQGIKTAVALIAAEELDVALARIVVESADSARPPQEFMTVGSMSIETTGPAVRRAAAEARRLLLARAASRLGVAASELSVHDGSVRAASGASVSYWELHAGARFEHTITMLAELKRPDTYALVGKRAPRIDLPAIVFGRHVFVQDLAPDGVVHARVVRPQHPNARLRSVELEPARALPGVLTVVRDGSFLGVIAEREEQAIAAAARLRADAEFEPPALPDERALHQTLLGSVVGSYPLVNGVPVEAEVPAPIVPETAAHTVRATYRRPYIMHASIGPAAALARFDPAGPRVEIACASQGVSLLAAAVAQVLGLPVESVRCRYVEGPGCYGHNGADDAALEVALLARALPDRQVLLKWTRADEHAHEPYGPAMQVDAIASVDARGRIVAYNHDVYSYSHIGRAFPMGKRSALIAAQQLEDPFPAPRPRPMLAPQAGVHRNAEPLYTIPAQRVVKRLCGGSVFRTSSLRSLGAYTNVFAIESMIDELAVAAGKDPVAFRLEHLEDERARAVIEAAASRMAARGALTSGGDSQRPRGRGIAFSRYENHKCYAAISVELEVDLSSYAIRVLHAVIAADAGAIVDPDGLANQLEGGFLQSMSFTLKEEVRWNADGVTSLDWESYPILNFEEVPEVEVVLLERPNRASRGAGEATTGPAPAAIANALYAACGVRLRTTPFTPARVRDALFAVER